MAEYVAVQFEGRIATITLNNPKKLNVSGVTLLPL